MNYLKWRSSVIYFSNKRNKKVHQGRVNKFYSLLQFGFRTYPSVVAKIINNYQKWGTSRDLLYLYNINRSHVNVSYKLDSLIIDILTRDLLDEQLKMHNQMKINGIGNNLLTSNHPCVKSYDFNIRLIDSIYPNNRMTKVSKIKKYNEITTKTRKYIEDPIPFITTKTLDKIDLNKLTEKQLNFIYKFLIKYDGMKEKLEKHYYCLYSSLKLSELINKIKMKTNEIQKKVLEIIWETNKNFFKVDELYLLKEKNFVINTNTTFYKELNSIYSNAIILHLNNKNLFVHDTKLTKIEFNNAKSLFDLVSILEMCQCDKTINSELITDHFLISSTKSNQFTDDKQLTIAWHNDNNINKNNILKIFLEHEIEQNEKHQKMFMIGFLIILIISLIALFIFN